MGGSTAWMGHPVIQSDVGLARAAQDEKSYQGGRGRTLSKLPSISLAWQVDTARTPSGGLRRKDVPDGTQKKRRHWLLCHGVGLVVYPGRSKKDCARSICSELGQNIDIFDILLE